MKMRKPDTKKLNHAIDALMFAFFDYGEPKLYFFADYLASMILFAICGHYAALLLKRNNVVKG